MNSSQPEENKLSTKRVAPVPWSTAAAAWRAWAHKAWKGDAVKSLGCDIPTETAAAATGPLVPQVT